MTSVNGGYSTVCRLCPDHKEIARAPLPLNVPLEGQPDVQSLMYLSMLDKHLKKRHPEQAAALESAVMEFAAMLLIQCYQVDDQSVNARADLIRDAFINQLSRHVSDAELAAIVTRFTFIPTEHHPQLTELLIGLRDLFTCRGKYAPQTTALKEAPLVLVP